MIHAMIMTWSSCFPCFFLKIMGCLSMFSQGVAAISHFMAHLVGLRANYASKLPGQQNGNRNRVLFCSNQTCYFPWRPCHDHVIFHDDHATILPWSYHVIAWSSFLTMAVYPGWSGFIILVSNLKLRLCHLLFWICEVYQLADSSLSRFFNFRNNIAWVSKIGYVAFPIDERKSSENNAISFDSAFG